VRILNASSKGGKSAKNSQKSAKKGKITQKVENPAKTVKAGHFAGI